MRSPPGGASSLFGRDLKHIANATWQRRLSGSTATNPHNIFQDLSRHIENQSIPSQNFGKTSVPWYTPFLIPLPSLTVRQFVCFWKLNPEQIAKKLAGLSQKWNMKNKKQWIDANFWVATPMLQPRGNCFGMFPGLRLRLQNIIDSKHICALFPSQRSPIYQDTLNLFIAALYLQPVCCHRMLRSSVPSLRSQPNPCCLSVILGWGSKDFASSLPMSSVCLARSWKKTYDNTYDSQFSNRHATKHWDNIFVPPTKSKDYENLQKYHKSRGTLKFWEWQSAVKMPATFGSLWTKASPNETEAASHLKIPRGHFLVAGKDRFAPV